MLGGRPCISRTAVAALLSAQLLPCSLGVHHSPGFVSAVRHHSKAGQLGQNAVRITGTAGNILGWRRNGLAAHVSGGLRGGEESGSAVEKAGIFLSQALSFARAQILPLGLLWAIAFGLWQPAAGVSFGRFPAAGYAAHAIFFLGGLVLKTDEAKEAIMATKAVSFGVLSILLLTSVLGVLITGALPLPVREFSTGASLFVCMPCTIQSGAALSLKAGGNFALSLLLTVLCSTGGIFTVPLVLDKVANLGGSVSLPVQAMVLKLIETALVPLASAKLLTETSPSVKALVARNRPMISTLGTLCIVMTPWIQISRSAEAGVFSAVKAADVAGIIALLSLTHVAFLVMNYVGSRALRLTQATTKSVVFVASSKTLPLSLSILGVLPVRIGDKGLIALPCILGHFAQIIIDSLLVSAWRPPSEN